MKNRQSAFLLTTIKNIDAELLQLLADRILMVEKISEIIKTEGMPIFIQEQEEVIKSRMEDGKRYGFSEDWIKEFFSMIMLESKKNKDQDN